MRQRLDRIGRWDRVSDLQPLTTFMHSGVKSFKRMDVGFQDRILRDRHMRELRFQMLERDRGIWGARPPLTIPFSCFPSLVKALQKHDTATANQVLEMSYFTYSWATVRFMFIWEQGTLVIRESGASVSNPSWAPEAEARIDNEWMSAFKTFFCSFANSHFEAIRKATEEWPPVDPPRWAKDADPPTSFRSRV